MTKTLLCVLALLWVWCLDGHAYVRSAKSNGVPIKWADGQATLNPQIGCSLGLCYTDAVRAAAQEWKPCGCSVYLSLYERACALELLST